MFSCLIGVMVLPDICLSFLTRMSWKNQQDKTTLQIYACLVAASFVSGMIIAGLLYNALLRSARNLHHIMVSCLHRAAVLFFDTNPAWRILNRCSKDIGYIDELLPKMFLHVTRGSLVTLKAILLPSFLNFSLFLVTIPFIAACLYLTRYYLNTSRELKRLESICRSPVFSHFSETMAGLSTIRSRKKEKDFIEQFYR